MKRGIECEPVWLSVAEIKKRGAGQKSVVLPLVEREFKMMTDDALQYFGKLCEYVRCEFRINTTEGCSSILKRRMKGIYQHCDEQHF